MKSRHMKGEQLSSTEEGMSMMKTLKKLAGLLLAVCMLLGVSATALAADITIGNGEDQGNYNAYQILNLTTSLKTKDCHSDETHESECYNYAYTVNEKYRSVLQAVVFAAQWNTQVMGTKPGQAGQVTDDQILAYINGLTSDTVTTEGDETVRTPGTSRIFADALYRAILSNEPALDADVKVTGRDTLSGVDQGYWLIADVTNPEEYDADSLVMLDTAGHQTITVSPKKSTPTVDKKQKVEEDADYSDDPVDVNIGDKVYFELTGTLPENLSSYVKYSYQFHDQLSDGLTFNNDVKVTIDRKDYTDEFVISAKDDDNASDFSDGCNLHISCADLLAIKDQSGTAVVSKDSKIVVTYTATLNSDAEIGNPGNPNKVKLEYSNNPYDDGTGKTPDDEVVVFTFGLNVDKVDAATKNEQTSGYDTKLKDAEFVLYRVAADGSNEYVKYETKTVNDAEQQRVSGWTTDKTKASVLTSDENGNFKLYGLDAGTYYLEETKAPAGFNLLKNPIKIEIKAVYGVNESTGEKAVTELTAVVTVSEEGDSVTNTGNPADGTVSLIVENNSGIELPSTGGMGTTIFYAVGVVLIIGAAVIYLVIRRKNAR